MLTRVVQDYVNALKQKVVKLEAMATRNSNDKGITAQVWLLCSPLWLQNPRSVLRIWPPSCLASTGACHGGSVQCCIQT